MVNRQPFPLTHGKAARAGLTLDSPLPLRDTPGVAKAGYPPATQHQGNPVGASDLDAGTLRGRVSRLAAPGGPPALQCPTQRSRQRSYATLLNFPISLRKRDYRILRFACSRVG